MEEIEKEEKKLYTGKYKRTTELKKLINEGFFFELLQQIKK